MCGLVGMMGPGVLAGDLKMLKDMSYINGLRGRDGAGIVQGHFSKHKQEYKISKCWQDIGYLMWFNEWAQKGDRKFLNDYHCNFFAVHARWATVGLNSDNNSHPFEFKNVVGMHNGTLEDSKYFHATKTDSELMFAEMNERGIEETLRDLDPRSAYAIVVLDKETNELVFARNDQRPLYFCHNLERGVTYWASEIEFMKLAAVRNKIKISDFVYLSPGKVYRVNPVMCKAGEWPEWKSEALFQKGLVVATTPPPTPNPSQVVLSQTTQENIELERAAKSGEKLIEDAKAVRHTPRILDSKLEATELWKDPDDLKFNPRRLTSCLCDYCGDELNLLQKYYARSKWVKTVENDFSEWLMCEECSESLSSNQTRM